MTARFIVADVFEGLATLETGSVDVVITSPPFLALRSYLPADHPDKTKEIGSEATPAEFIDTLLKVTAELRRVLAPHGSICVELGDTFSGGNTTFQEFKDAPQDEIAAGNHLVQYGDHPMGAIRNMNNKIQGGGPGWPLAKSRTLIPSLYEIALAYGFNPLTGLPSPAGQWRIRNVVTWARPNPPVGALGDKWRPATSDLIVACTSAKRYWDDLATRKLTDLPTAPNGSMNDHSRDEFEGRSQPKTVGGGVANASGAPLLDYWVIPPGGYTGAHYAVFPEELVVPCVQAMCPQKVCVVCGEPSRRITESEYTPRGNAVTERGHRQPRVLNAGSDVNPSGQGFRLGEADKSMVTVGWSDCGHDNWRPGLVLDPFAGSGTTLAVATGHGYDAIGLDIDDRNAELARDRVGPFLFEMVDLPA